MTQAAKIAPSPSGRAALINTIAIASGKGGVGKTWLSITLCHALARAGCKTLLFDGDLGLGQVLCSNLSIKKNNARILSTILLICILLKIKE